MNNLLNKMNLIQFIIIMLFYLLSNKINSIDDNIDNNNNTNTLKKDSEYYLFLKNIVIYNKITEKYIKFIKKNKDLPIDNNKILLNNNEYFYLLVNSYKIVIIVFCKKDQD